MTEVTTTLTKRQAFRLLPLVVLAKTNPKKKGTMSFARFENYFKLEGDVTIQDALDAGVRMDDIRHDSEHGFILIGDKAEAYVPPREMTSEDLYGPAATDEAPTETPSDEVSETTETPADETADVVAEEQPKRARSRK